VEAPNFFTQPGVAETPRGGEQDRVDFESWIRLRCFPDLWVRRRVQGRWLSSYSGLMAAGMTNPQIAAQLVIAAGTVKTHTLTIYRKLEVANRTQAILRAQELGLLHA